MHYILICTPSPKWTRPPSLKHHINTSGVKEGRREGSVLFNDALNTFYLRLYGRKEGNAFFNDALNIFNLRLYGRKAGNVLFNDILNTFNLRLYGRKEGRKCFI